MIVVGFLICVAAGYFVQPLALSAWRSFRNGYAKYAAKIAGQLVESEYDRQRAEHDCGDPLCAGLPWLNEVSE